MMNEELKVLLNRNLEVSEASQKILKKIYADILWRRVFAFIKWGIIIVIFVWSYLQLQPVLKSVLESYQKLLNSSGVQAPAINFNTLPPEVQKILEGFLKK